MCTVCVCGGEGMCVGEGVCMEECVGEGMCVWRRVCVHLLYSQDLFWTFMYPPGDTMNSIIGPRSQAYMHSSWK